MSTIQLHPNNSASSTAGASNVVNLHSFKGIVGAADGDEWAAMRAEADEVVEQYEDFLA